MSQSILNRFLLFQRALRNMITFRFGFVKTFPLYDTMFLL